MIKALVAQGAETLVVLAGVLGVSANHIQLKDPLDRSLAILPCRRGQTPQSKRGRNQIDNPNYEDDHWGKP